MNSPAHPTLTKLSSSIGMAVIIGLFAVYALTRYIAFPIPHVPGTTDITPILLASQFAIVLCLLLLIRAARHGRVFKGLFVAFLAIPLISSTTTAAFHVAMGIPISLDALKGATILFNPLVWVVLGAQGLLLVGLVLWQRWRKQ